MRSGSASAEDRLSGRQNFCLDEQIRERRMGRLRIGSGQDDFGVTGEFNRPRNFRTIDHRRAADLDIVLGRNRDLGVQLDLAVAPPEFGSRLRENRLITFRRLQGWLM